MKKLVMILLLLSLIAGVAYAVWGRDATAPIDTDNVRQLSGDSWMKKVAADWKKFVEAEGFEKRNIKTVAIAPLKNDENGYLTSALQKAFASQGVELVTRNPKELAVLQSEIDNLDENAKTKVDPKTVQQLGKGLGCDAFLIGRVYKWDTNLAGAHARTRGVISLIDTETGGIPWTTGPVEAEAYIHWTDFLTNFWEYPAILSVLAVIVILILLGVVVAILGGVMRTMKAM